MGKSTRGTTPTGWKSNIYLYTNQSKNVWTHKKLKKIEGE